MAGVITGSVDHRLGAPAQVGADNNQEAFTAVYDYLNSKYTRIASNFGSGGTGFDFFDGANPSGENAFAVFRAAAAVNPFNVLIQWADGATWGAAPGNPGEIDGANVDGVAIAMAVREDATDPWAGGVADVGADAKGATVWTPGGSTLHCLDRANSPGPTAGNFNTNKENCGSLCDVGNTGALSRWHVVGDDDGFLVMNDTNNVGIYRASYYGAYTPRSGIVMPLPLVAVMNRNLAGMWSQVIHGNIAASTGEEGGILGRVLADGVRSFNVGVANPGSTSATYQPNNQLLVPELEGELVALLRNELNVGLCGYCPSALLTSVFGVANHETNAAATRAYVGHTSSASRKFSIPWDGGSPPGTINTRAGRQF